MEIDKENKLPEINIYYEKNPSYRTIYSDGLIGGITPRGDVNLNFYSTRNVIPKSIKHNILSDGTIDKDGKVSEDSKNGIIREIEFGVYMTKDTAESIYTVLKNLLEKNDI